MIPRPQMIPNCTTKDPRTGTNSIAKVGNVVDSMKSLWMDMHILIILGEEKTSTSGIKAAIKNVKQTAQNTKLST